MELLVVRPDAKGVPLAKFTVHVGFKKSGDRLFDAVGAGLHGGGSVNYNKKPVLHWPRPLGRVVRAADGGGEQSHRGDGDPECGFGKSIHG
jgi:hypothetical protein